MSSMRRLSARSRRREWRRKIASVLSAALAIMVAGSWCKPRSGDGRPARAVSSHAERRASRCSPCCELHRGRPISCLWHGRARCHPVFGNMGSMPNRLQSLSRPGGCTSRAEWTTNSAVRGEWNDARFKDHFHVSRTTHKSVVAGRAQ